MRILQHKRYSELFRRTEETMTKNGKLSVYLGRFEAKQQGHIDTSEAEGKHILNRPWKPSYICRKALPSRNT